MKFTVRKIEIVYFVWPEELLEE